MSVLILLTFLLTIVDPSAFAKDPEDGFDWRIKLLIVTGNQIKDGHRRLYRTANAVDLPAKIISVDDEDDEVSQIAEALKQEPFVPTDVVVVINSDEYIVAKEPVMTSWKIIVEALKKEAGILLSSPATHPRDNKDILERIEETENALEEFRDAPGLARKTHSKADMKDYLKLLEKLRRLEVEEKQSNREAKLHSSNPNFKAYAFGGMVSSMIEFLEDFKKNELVGSMDELWHLAFNSLSMRHRYELAFDEDQIIFQDIRTIRAESYSYMKGHSSKVFLNAPSNVVISPFLYADPLPMPFLPANIMAKEVGTQEPCPDCLDEPLPVGTPLAQRMDDVPTVQIIALIEHSVPFIMLFLKYLTEIDYPKEKIQLAVYVSQTAAEHLEDVEKYLNDNRKSFQRVRMLRGSEAMDDYMSVLHLLNKAKQMRPDYVFMVEAKAHITHGKILQELMNKKRNIVGPLLIGGERINIVTEYSGGRFQQGPLLNNYMKREVSEKKDFQFIGLLQVPRMSGAILMSEQAYSSIIFINEKGKGNVWNFFYKQIIEQGFIPYASNEIDYGYLISESENYKSDVWGLSANSEAFLTYYVVEPTEPKIASTTFHSTTLHQKQRQFCRNLDKHIIFNSHFVNDLLQDVTGSLWKTHSKENGTEVLEPVEKLDNLQNVYVQSIVRFFLGSKVSTTQIPLESGKMRIIRGKGRVTVPGSMMVIVSLARDRQMSMVEVDGGDERGNCVINLKEGEAAFVEAHKTLSINLVEDSPVVTFSL